MSGYHWRKSFTKFDQANKTQLLGYQRQPCRFAQRFKETKACPMVQKMIQVCKLKWIESINVKIGKQNDLCINWIICEYITTESLIKVLSAATQTNESQLLIHHKIVHLRLLIVSCHSTTKPIPTYAEAGMVINAKYEISSTCEPCFSNNSNIKLKTDGILKRTKFIPKLRIVTCKREKSCS